MESVKHKLLDIILRLGLLSKRAIALETGEEISSLDYDTFLRISSSNNIVELKSDKEHMYFRKIHEKLSTWDELIDRILYDYSCLRNVDLEQLKLVVVDRKRFYDMGALNNRSSRLYKSCSSGNHSLIGISPEANNVLGNDELTYFINYAWSEIIGYKHNRAISKHQLLSYSRTRCQENIYKLFGLSSLICESRLVKICGRSKHIGLLQFESPGINSIKISSDQLASIITGELILRLDMLNVLDIICCEKDHRPGNYNLVMGGGEKAVSIITFDNDSPLTFLPRFSINDSYVSSSSIIDSNGYYARPFIDKTFVDSILSVEEDELVKAISPYLNFVQRYATLVRFKKIKSCIRKTITEFPERVVNINSLKPSFIEEYTNNLKGESYYTVLLKWREELKDPIFLAQGNLPLLKIDL